LTTFRSLSIWRLCPHPYLIVFIPSQLHLRLLCHWHSLHPAPSHCCHCFPSVDPPYCVSCVPASHFSDFMIVFTCPESGFSEVYLWLCQMVLEKHLVVPCCLLNYPWVYIEDSTETTSVYLCSPSSNHTLYFKQKDCVSGICCML
jgi:hypothetical protein